MQLTWVLLIVTVAMVLVFDLTNGFHDSSNMIATLVASRAMTPLQALLLVGVFTFLGPLLAGTAVADTIGGFVSLGNVPEQLGMALVLCGIVAAVTWRNLSMGLSPSLGGAIRKPWPRSPSP